MVEAFQEHDLGPDVDHRGNLLKEIAEPVSLDEAVWKLNKEKQEEVIRYVELDQKIKKLPKFEQTEVNTLIVKFLSGEMSAQGEAYKEYGIVQYFGGSGRPLSYWENCSFNTEDGRFEGYLESKVRPAVEGMIEDMGENN